MLDRLLAAIAPHQCLVCGCEGALLCSWCCNDAVPLTPSRCYGCRQVTNDHAVCIKCRRRTALRHVWVRASYSEVAHDLVYRLKFSRTKQAAETIARLLDDTVPFLESPAVITYVPTATSRVRLRGYDQSRLIAKAFARRRGLSMKPLVARAGQSRQVGASKTERRKQAAKNYHLLGNIPDGSHVVVVDDVLTTGATLESVAKLLRSAGVKRVDAVVFAQK